MLAINRNWRYRSDVPAGFEAREFDDSQFERVVIPHTNKRLPWHSFDEKSYEFISAYRRRFKLPPQAKGKHVFVDFEGAMTASTVWINGQKLGEYKGGYTPFSFELTPHLDWDGENVLAVAVAVSALVAAADIDRTHIHLVVAVHLIGRGEAAQALCQIRQ